MNSASLRWVSLGISAVAGRPLLPSPGYPAALEGLRLSSQSRSPLILINSAGALFPARRAGRALSLT